MYLASEFSDQMIYMICICTKSSFFLVCSTRYEYSTEINHLKYSASNASPRMWDHLRGNKQAFERYKIYCPEARLQQRNNQPTKLIKK